MEGSTHPPPLLFLLLSHCDMVLHTLLLYQVRSLEPPSQCPWLLCMITVTGHLWVQDKTMRSHLSGRYCNAIMWGNLFLLLFAEHILWYPYTMTQFSLKDLGMQQVSLYTLTIQLAHCAFFSFTSYILKRPKYQTVWKFSCQTCLVTFVNLREHRVWIRARSLVHIHLSPDLLSYGFHNYRNMFTSAQQINFNSNGIAAITSTIIWYSSL